MMKVGLIEPAVELQDEFTAMVREWLDQEGTDSQAMWEGVLDDFPAYVQFLQADASPRPVQPGWVNCGHFWLVTPDRRIIGTSRLRHSLLPHLEQEGGHIGYDIRPSERRKGYGTRLLALTLQKAQEIGLACALITCDEENIGSVRVIEKNGGELASKGISERTGKAIVRYWIDITKRRKTRTE